MATGDNLKPTEPNNYRVHLVGVGMASPWFGYGMVTGDNLKPTEFSCRYLKVR